MAVLLLDSMHQLLTITCRVYEWVDNYDRCLIYYSPEKISSQALSSTAIRVLICIGLLLMVPTSELIVLQQDLRRKTLQV